MNYYDTYMFMTPLPQACAEPFNSHKHPQHMDQRAIAEVLLAIKRTTVRSANQKTKCRAGRGMAPASPRSGGEQWPVQRNAPCGHVESNWLFQEYISGNR